MSLFDQSPEDAERSDVIVTAEDIQRIGLYLDFAPGFADDSEQAFICRRIAFYAASYANGISKRNRRKNYRERIAYLVHERNNPRTKS